MLYTIALDPQEGWIVVVRGVYNETPESVLDFKKLSFFIFASS